MPDILMLRALGLGDFLTAIPAMRALRNGFSDHRITLAAPRALWPLVSMAAVVDELVDQHGLQDLPRPIDPPALAVNLHGKGPQSHRLLQTAAPRRLTAFRCPAAGHDGPEWDQGEHEVVRWCRLITESLDIPADPTDLRLRQTGDGIGRLLDSDTAILHPGAAYEARRWPIDRWVHVARYLTDRGLQVRVTGDASEVERAAEVVARAGLPSSSSIAGKTALPELVEQVAAARVVVCGDTGVAHLATALETPSLLLFGPTSPRRWGPPDNGPHRVLWHGDGTGDPWGDRPDPALLRISTDEVTASLDELLGRLDMACLERKLLREPIEGPG